jgi:hypothetical protein
MFGLSGKKRSATTKRVARKLVQGIPSIRSLSRKNCPPGMIPRKAYVRRYSTAVRSKGFTVKKSSGKLYHVRPTSKNMLVESTCIKNVGLHGKSPKMFGPLKKGELAKHGYSFRGSEAERHAALKKAIAEYGSTGVFRKLNAVSKLTRRVSPKAANVFSKDREWVHKTI